MAQGRKPLCGGDESGNDRDIDANRTVISGDILQNDSPTDPTSYYENNAFFIFTFVGLTEKFVLDGFVIEHGDAGTHLPAQNPYEFDPPEYGGGAIFVTESTSGSMKPPIIQNCLVENNFGQMGGAIAASRLAIANEATADIPVLDIRTSTIRLNYSLGEGGGIALRNTSISMEGLLVVDNEAASFGGGITAERVLPPSFARGNLGVRLTNCTLASNHVPYDSAAGLLVYNILEATDVFFLNTICAQNLAVDDFSCFLTQVLVDIPSDSTLLPDFNYSAFPDATAVQYGEANVAVVYPLFVDATNTNRSQRDYRVFLSSPCRDSGQRTGVYMPIDTFDADDDDNVTELLPDRSRTERVRESDGYTTIVASDIGAFEHDSEPLCASDLNADSQVNASDLGILLGMWGACAANHAPPASACQCADLNNDTLIDAFELGVLLGAWGRCGTSMMVSSVEGESAEDAAPQPSDVAWLFGFASLDEFAL